MSSQNETSSLRLRTSCTSTSSNNEVFKCEQHFVNISKKLQSFYVEEEFFDIILIAGIDKVEIPAHRIILSASSDFFLVMFRNNLKEVRSAEVELKDVNSATLKLIVGYMYTASIELSAETVESILRTADFLQMDDLIAGCCNFIGKQLDVSNCIGFALFAEQHSYVDLYRKCLTIAYEHYEMIYSGQEFYEMNEKQLTKFITNDCRCMRPEEKLFLALMAWVEHDKINREKLFCNLLSHVRFSLLKPKFIIDNRPSVGKSVEANEIMFSWLQWHLSPETRNVSPIQRNKSQRLAFVTADKDDFFKVSIFNSELNFWMYDEWPRPSVERTDYSTLVIRNKLVIAGGNTVSGVTNCVECLDLDTMEWTVLAPMLTKRSKVGIVELDDCVYIVGGFDGKNWTCEVEVYDFATDSWDEVEPLPEALEDVQVVVHLWVIYAAENFDTYAYRYDPDMNEWTSMPSKIEDCILFGMAAVGEYVYVVGGDINEADSNTVERYDPKKNTWTFVKPLLQGRLGIKCVAYNNRLVACAGTYNDIQQQLVEEYNPETNEWKTLSPLLLREYISSNLFTV